MRKWVIACIVFSALLTITSIIEGDSLWRMALGLVLPVWAVFFYLDGRKQNDSKA